MKLRITLDQKTYEVDVEVAEDDRAPANAAHAYIPAAPTALPSGPPPPRPAAAPDSNVAEDKVCRSPVAGIVVVGEGPNLVQSLEALGPDSPVQKPIDKNGGRGGLAHVAFRVRNAQIAFQYMKEAGFQLIDKAPRPGSRGTTVFFVHPKSLGVLIEIVEDPAA